MVYFQEIGNRCAELLWLMSVYLCVNKRAIRTDVVTPWLKKLMGKHEKLTVRPVKGDLYTGGMYGVGSLEGEEERNWVIECMDMNSDLMADNSGDAEVQTHARHANLSMGRSARINDHP